MDRMIYTAMTGAKQVFVQQAAVAHNLANASTNGFRAQDHSFRAVPILGEGMPTRAFVADASVADVLDQGPMISTGRSLDVALQGKGWFVLEGRDGNEVYTRAGSFDISANGQLQSKDGLNVIGDGGPISIPPDSRIAIASDGTISAIPETGTLNAVNVVGRIKLVNPPEGDLVRGPDGMFRLRGGEPAPLDDNVRLVSETLEGSNVNVVDAMVGLISLSRQFEMQIRAIQNAEQNDRQAAQILSIAQ